MDSEVQASRRQVKGVMLDETMNGVVHKAFQASSSDLVQ